MSSENIDVLIARVKIETDWDRWRAGWMEVFSARGHSPVLDEDGNPDLFVTSPNGHNGPGCITCGWTTCMHCCAVDRIPSCNVNPPSVPGPSSGERT